MLRPVRDVAGWFSDTFDAKSQRDQLHEENQSYRRARRLPAGADPERPAGPLVGLDNTIGTGNYKPVAGERDRPRPDASGTRPSRSTRARRRRPPRRPGRRRRWSGREHLLRRPQLLARCRLITDHTSAVTAEIQHTEPRQRRAGPRGRQPRPAAPSVPAPQRPDRDQAAGRHRRLRLGSLESLYPRGSRSARCPTPTRTRCSTTARCRSPRRRPAPHRRRPGADRAPRRHPAGPGSVTRSRSACRCGWRCSASSRS